MTAAASVTPNDIITLALKDSGVVGVGQTPLAEDSNQALTRLNWMVDQWSRSRWLVWALATYSIISTGAQSYTVGPTGSDIVIDPRPDRIESAFVRQLNTGANAVDYPLSPIEARETYNLISLKSLSSFPNQYFYDSAFPQGNLFPWPVPQASIYSVFITVKTILSEFPDLTTPIALSPEYFSALHTNLAVILRDAYGLPPKPILNARAKGTLNVIRKANVQIPRLQMPKALTRPGLYNIYSDTYY